MKLSTPSKVLVGFYVVTSLLCVLIALSTSDTKGNFVFLQLPIAWQISLIPSSFFKLLPAMNWIVSWILSYIFFGGLTILLLIFLGESIDKLANE